MQQMWWVGVQLVALPSFGACCMPRFRLQILYFKVSEICICEHGRFCCPSSFPPSALSHMLRDSATIQTVSHTCSCIISLLVVLFLQTHKLKLVCEVKRSVPERVSAAEEDFCEVLLQAYYVLRGFSEYHVDTSCMFCLSDCSRFHYFRLPTANTVVL